MTASVIRPDCTSNCGGCSPTGTSRATVDWSTEKAFCETSGYLTCKDNSVCLPSTASCLLTDGERSCPSGFPRREVLYSGLSGSPTCTCTGCEGSTADPCSNAKYQFNEAGRSIGQIGSSGGQLDITSVTEEFRATICGTAESSSAYCKAAPSANQGRCAAPQTESTGRLTPNDPMTVCCAG